MFYETLRVIHDEVHQWGLIHEPLGKISEVDWFITERIVDQFLLIDVFDVSCISLWRHLSLCLFRRV